MDAFLQFARADDVALEIVKPVALAVFDELFEFFSVHFIHSKWMILVVPLGRDGSIQSRATISFAAETMDSAAMPWRFSSASGAPERDSSVTARWRHLQSIS